MSQNHTHIEMTNMLKQIHAEADTPPCIEPEAFLVHLKQREHLRPPHINDILHAFASQYPTNLLILLDNYLMELEENTRQQSPFPTQWDKDNPAYWSHHQMVKRQQRRHDREMKKITKTY